METDGPEPKLSLQNALGNLKEAYSKHYAGQIVDDRAQLARDITTLCQGLGQKHKKNPHLMTVLQKCAPLAKDPNTGENLISDPQMLDLIYPHRHRKPQHRLRKRLALGAAALGTAALGTAGILLIKEIADLKAQGGPPPILYNSGKLFQDNLTERVK